MEKYSEIVSQFVQENFFWILPILAVLLVIAKILLFPWLESLRDKKRHKQK